jgi:hypothetical protein
VRICGDLVLSAAERLAAAARVDAPYKVEAQTRQGRVTITADGADQATVARLRSKIDETAKVSGGHRVTAGVSLGVAAVFLVLAFVAGWGWLVVALGGVGLGIYQWIADVRKRRDAAAQAEAMHERLATEVESRVTALVDCRTRLKDRQATVDDDLKALRHALT